MTLWFVSLDSQLNSANGEIIINFLFFLVQATAGGAGILLHPVYFFCFCDRQTEMTTTTTTTTTTETMKTTKTTTTASTMTTTIKTMTTKTIFLLIFDNF